MIYNWKTVSARNQSLPDISHRGAAGWSYENFTSKDRTKHVLVHQLCEVFSRFKGHLLYQAKFVIMNQNTFGRPHNTNGIYHADALPSTDLASWWYMVSNDHGFGIFHSVKLDKVTGQYIMVSWYHYFKAPG